MKVKPGDYVSWGSWKIGQVLDVYPKDILYIRVSPQSSYPTQDFLLDAKNSSDPVVVVTADEGWRFLDPTEDTLKGDLIWTGREWTDMSVHYSGDKTGLAIKRKI